MSLKELRTISKTDPDTELYDIIHSVLMGDISRHVRYLVEKYDLYHTAKEFFDWIESTIGLDKLIRFSIDDNNQVVTSTLKKLLCEREMIK